MAADGPGQSRQLARLYAGAASAKIYPLRCKDNASGSQRPWRGHYPDEQLQRERQFQHQHG